MNHSGNTGRFVRAVLAGALAGSLSMPIGAMPIWTNAGTGDWFVAGNWDTGFVPTPADDVQVNNGGTAVADSSSAAYPGPGTLSETNAFDVGVRTNTLAPAIGTVQMLGVNLAVGDALSIGVVNSGFGIGPFTSATGNLETSAGANADGNVDVVTDARVGVFVAAPGAGTATGTANVAGDFTGSGTGQVLVGDVSGQGNANGTLGVSGNLGGFTGVTVATANLLSTGNATGDLTVDGMLSVSGPAANLTVGLTGSQGNATGSAQVGGAVTGVNFVGIGLGGTDTGPTSMAKGTLDVLSGGVHAGFDASSFEVGTTNGDGDGTGVANVSGGVSGYRTLQLGVARRTGQSGNAQGTLNVVGSVLGTDTGQVLAGEVSGQGNANGTLGVTGDLGGFTGVTVATANLLSTGNATGDLTVDGMLSVSGPAANLTVGLTGSQGNATGSAQVGGAVTGVNFVGIGLGGTDTGPTSMAQGTLDVLSGGVHAGFDASSFEVGTTNGDGDVTGVANVSGGVSGYRTLQLGVARRTGQSGNAQGTLNVVGSVLGTDTGQVLAGDVSGQGNANGTLGVTGDLGGFTGVTVATANLLSTGNATGDLTVDGMLSVSGPAANLTVGVTGSQGNATGSAQVGGAVTGVNFVGIGLGGTDTGPTSMAQGTLDVLSGGVHAGFDASSFEVGTTNGDGDVTGVANVNGGVSGYRTLQLGVARRTGQSGNAQSTLNVVGSVLGTDTGQVLVGDVSGQGNASGILGVTGDLGGFTGVSVARANLLSTGNATGDLTVGGMLSVSGPAANFTVGTIGSQGNAIGTAQVGGAVTGFNLVGIGLAGTDTGPTSMAQGTLDVLSGGVHAGFDASSFEVGTTNGDGDVTGVANVNGGVSGYGFYEIGIARANSLGDATGMLAVKDGPVTGSRMRVGISEGGGTATGTVELERSLVALDEALILGSGATLDFHLSGLSRGGEYAAIDAVMATLDGTANIYFDFVPMLGIHVFDLIVTQALDGILNDFDPGAFNIFGLDPLFNVVHGIVVDNVLGNDVEIYRLEISSSIANVPEPSVVTLLAFSLLILFATRRRENHRFGFG
jgi:hypothetical protein